MKGERKWRVMGTIAIEFAMRVDVVGRGLRRGKDGREVRPYKGRDGGNRTPRARGGE
jgi:hypothetical protein